MHRFNNASPGSGRLTSRASELASTRADPPRFLVGERQRRLYPLDPKSIDYIEADGNYVTLRVGKVEYLSRDSIKNLSTELAELGFMRIDAVVAGECRRGVICRTWRVMEPLHLTLTSGACLHSTAVYRDSILRIIPLPALSKRYGGTAS